VHFTEFEVPAIVAPIPHGSGSAEKLAHHGKRLQPARPAAVLESVSQLRQRLALINANQTDSTSRNASTKLTSFVRRARTVAMSQGNRRVAPMPHQAGDTTVYTGNRADGDAIQINGNVHGDVHFPERPREAGEPSPHQCLRDLRVTNPREDRARIEGDKDRLLRDCYVWILEDASFQQWRAHDASRLLWIKGDPGKGKTMMMMGLIAELSQGQGGGASSRPVSKMISRMKAKMRLSSRPHLLAYFFCQSTRPELNNAVSVLRGLVYMLVAQREQLLRHVQKQYATAGKQLFEGPNAIYALGEMLSNMLDDVSLPTTYLLVDALDECATGLPDLLHIITGSSPARRSRVKWLVTSRNIPDIERYLQPDAAGIQVSLEVSTSHVSKAVAAFVNFKVQDLATVKRYEAKLQAEVKKVLRGKAEGTFLWVSLVCKELEGVEYHRTREVLRELPPGLDPLYERMMGQILAQHNVKTAEFCKAVLRAVTITFRPLRLSELVVVAGLPSDQFDDPQAVADLVSRCGSFLTIRQDTASFIHLSAKDYLMAGNGQHVFDGAAVEEHGQVTYRLLSAMRSSLRRDVCGIERLGAQTMELTQRIENSILTQIAYACEYWVDHLCASKLTSSATSEDVLQDGGVVDLFLSEKFLYWLEALSLCKSMSEGVVAVGKLWSLMQVSFILPIIKDC
jgi:hypothetical protein